MTPALWLVCILSILLICGCASSNNFKEPRAPRGAEIITYHDWPGAVRLFNDTAELVIVPSIGRVMRYGYVGGENLLWDDPKLHGREGAGADEKKWRNFGGEKVWPWPQDQWEKHAGRAWPPPHDVDQKPHDAGIIGDRTVRMISPPLPGYNVRIARLIRLAERGSRVTMEIEFIPTTKDETPAAVPWTIAQLRAPDLILARLVGAKALKPLPTFTWDVTRAIDSRTLQLERNPAKAEKLGIDADLLIWVKGSTFLVQRSMAATGNGFDPAERAQVFSQEGKPSYVEYEFIAPHGARFLTVTWELHDLPRDNATPAAIAGYLRNL